MSELKRRRVVRVGAIYAGSSFVVVQAADIIAPALHLPAWTMTLVVVLLILGLPVALALAWAFDITPAGTRVGAKSPARAPGVRGPARAALASVIVLTVVVSAWFGSRRLFGGRAEALDANAIAVVPFRVAGAEPALGYLREGMLDLLAAKLTSGTGPRAVDPRTLTAAWRQAAVGGDLSREQALALARRLGAGRLVLGEVVSLPGRVTLTASLTDVRTGRSAAPVSVEGAVDSLPSLVDRLVAALLSVGAGEVQRLASLTSASLPALRFYLEGQAAYRGGRYEQANTAFERALEIDSTFALAALMKHRGAVWLFGTGSAGDPAALALSWRHRDRLGPDDAALLAAVAGPRYPAWTPPDEWASAWEALVRRRPDSPDAWFEWGDFAFFHWGTHLGLPDTTARRRAADAFDRALALDSMYLTALAHLLDIATMRGDTAAVRRYTVLYLAREPQGPVADGIRNLRAAQTKGMRAVPEIMARVDSMAGTLRRLSVGHLSFHPSTWPQAFALADHHLALIGDPVLARDIGPGLTHLALNRGRPADAARVLDAYRTATQMDSAGFLATVVRFGLHADGDTAAAARAAAILAVRLRAVPDEAAQVHATCVLGQWQAARGDFAAAAPLRDRLRTMGDAGDSELHNSARLCGTLLDTWLAAGAHSADVAERIARLDALVTNRFEGVTDPDRMLRGLITAETNLVLARLLESRGDRAGALRALRLPAYTSAVQSYHSTFLRERGRVAALLGDTAAALYAYRAYLALRDDTEPVLRADVERVRGEVARLTAR